MPQHSLPVHVARKNSEPNTVLAAIQFDIYASDHTNAFDHAMRIATVLSAYQIDAL